jgi:hypothetical protein
VGYLDDLNTIDIGHGVKIAFVTNGAGEEIGILEEHPAVTESAAMLDGRCCGSVFWSVPEGDQRPTWQLVSRDPLTLSPSLLCRVCGNHGWIRNGKWEPA